jgi:hypothetical protein
MPAYINCIKQVVQHFAHKVTTTQIHSGYNRSNLIV